MAQRSGKEELVRATPRTCVHLRCGHGPAIRAWQGRQLCLLRPLSGKDYADHYSAGSIRIPLEPMPRTIPDKGCASTRPRQAPEKGILNRSLSGQEYGPLLDWRVVVCPPPRHPRAARYPGGLRGEQATFYLAQRSLLPCLSDPFASVMRRTRGLREAGSWSEGSRAPSLTPRTDSTFLSRAASPPQPPRNPPQISFQPVYRRFSSFDSWFEGNRLVV
jgi:hypothetical protein